MNQINTTPETLSILREQQAVQADAAKEEPE